MPLSTYSDGESGSSIRTKINAAITQVNTNTTDITAKQPLDADLTAIAALTTTGIITRTASATFAPRTITGTSNLITVANGDGVSGNPTITVGTDVVTLTGSQTLTNKTLTSPVINSPTGIFKSDVGLPNVDNTSDATKNSAPVALTNKLSLNTHSIPSGTGTLALTSDITTAISTKQDANAASTLYWNYRADVVTVVVGASDNNKIFHITNSGSTDFTLNQGAGLPVGGHVRLVNDPSSSSGITINGTATVVYCGGTSSLVATGEGALFFRASNTVYIRLS